MKRLLLIFAALLLLVAIPAQAQGKKCKKGKPCGNSCIAVSKTCHIGESPLSTAAPTAPVTAATPAATIPTSSEAPWVASPRGHTYYRNGCSGARELKNRIYFKTEEEAIAAKYTRSKQAGC